MILRQALLAVVALVLTGPVQATAQIPEEIVLDGQRQPLFSEPLQDYLKASGRGPQFVRLLSNARCTGSWRNYRGSWEVRGKRLLLQGIVTSPCDEKPIPVDLNELFPESPKPVPASWYTGTLVVPVGKVVECVHMGYETKFEGYLVMDVVNGEVVASRRMSSIKDARR